MASVGGDLPEAERQPLQDIAKAFGDAVRRLALAKGLPASKQAVWNAQWFFGAVDGQAYHILFAEQAGAQTSIRFMDLRKHGVVPLDTLAADVRMNIGEPIYGFSIPVADAKSGKRDTLINTHASAYVESVVQTRSQSAAPTAKVDQKLCFVIMSFSDNPQLRDFYELGIKPTIEKLGYRCERIDEQQFNGSIRDRILKNIAAAKFIVADVTEARPNCYYELGIAHSLGKEVVHLANDTGDIHFDIKDFNFIIYKRIADLKEKLEQRLNSTVGKAV